MDLLYTDKWLNPLIFSDENGVSNADDEDSNNQNEALNPYFEENGFSSKILIKNLGSTFVYLILYIVAVIFLFIINLSAKFSTR